MVLHQPMSENSSSIDYLSWYDGPLLRACLFYVLYCNVLQELDVFSHVKLI